MRRVFRDEISLVPSVSYILAILVLVVCVTRMVKALILLEVFRTRIRRLGWIPLRARKVRYVAKLEAVRVVVRLTLRPAGPVISPCLWVIVHLVKVLDLTFSILLLMVKLAIRELTRLMALVRLCLGAPPWGPKSLAIRCATQGRLATRR